MAEREPVVGETRLREGNISGQVNEADGGLEIIGDHEGRI